MNIDEVNELRQRLVDNGYLTVAVRTNMKRPAEAAWQRAEAFRPARVGALSTGLRTGRGILCIDIDCDDPHEAKNVYRRVVGVLGETPLIRSRSNSSRVALVYRALENEIKKFTIPLSGPIDGKLQQIEVLADGQQFVAFGQHDSGVEYEWLASSPLEVLVEDLPAIDSNDLIALQEAFGVVEEDEAAGIIPQKTAIMRAPSAALPAAAGDNFFRNTNNAALANLGKWVPLLFPGVRLTGQTYRITSRQLGRKLQEDLSISPLGIQDFGVEETRTAVDLVIEYGGAPDAEAGALWLCQKIGLDPSSLGHRSGMKEDPVEQARLEKMVAKLVEKAVAARQAVIIGADEHQVDPFGETYCHTSPDYPDGVLGEIVDWVVDTATKPNRPLAIAAAITVVSSACARQIVGPTGALTQLFMVGLGPSGSGKDWPLVSSRAMLRAAGMGQWPTGFKVTSSQAIDNLLKEHRCRTAIIDEVGDTLFARMSGKNASTHEAAISGALRSLWAVAPESEYDCSSRASGSGEALLRPCLTIFGVSTYDQFFRNISENDLGNGFLNRWLMIKGSATVGEFQTVPAEKLKVPADLADKIRMCRMPAGYMGNLTGGDIGPASSVPCPVMQIPWHSDAPQLLLNEFRGGLDRWISEGEGSIRSACYERVAEMAIRLATVHAVSRKGMEASVNESDMRWGISWALGSARYLMREMRNRWAESTFQRDYKRVEQLFREAPKGELTRSDLTRKINGRISMFILNQVIDALVSADKISEVNKPGKTRWTKFYKYGGKLEPKGKSGA